jgi:hypothetical protein
MLQLYWFKLSFSECTNPCYNFQCCNQQNDIVKVTISVLQFSLLQLPVLQLCSCGSQAIELTIEVCYRAYPWQLNIGSIESNQILFLLLQLVPKSATRGCLFAAVHHTIVIYRLTNYNIESYHHRNPLPHRLSTSYVPASPHPISLQQSNLLPHHRNSIPPLPLHSAAGHGAQKPSPKTSP